MYKTYILIIFFAIISLSSGQSRRGSNATAIQDGYLLTSLSGYGNSSSVLSTITGLGISNPALATDFSEFSTGISMQNSSILENFIINDFTFKNGINIPQSFEILFPVHRFRIGIGYNHIYDLILTSGLIPIITLGGELGGYSRAKTVTHILSKSAQLSWSTINNTFSIGLRITQNTLTVDEKVINSVFKSRGQKYSYNLGLVYNIIDQKMRVGASYSNGVSIVGNYTATSDSLVPMPDSVSYEIYGSIIPVVNKMAYIPSRLEIGTWYTLNPRSEIFGQIAYSYAINGDQSLKNKMEISINIRTRLNDRLTITTGYLNQKIAYRENFIFSSNNSGNHFLIISPIFDFGNVGLEYSLVIAYKQIDKKRTQIINKLGLNWSL